MEGAVAGRGAEVEWLMGGEGCGLAKGDKLSLGREEEARAGVRMGLSAKAGRD